jgi:hypothetical protein
MNRSPYHLTSATQRLPARRQSLQQRKDDDNNRAGTPPLGDEHHQEYTPAHAQHSNPIFQTQYGSAHRYGASRSMMEPHSYESDSAMVVGESSQNPWNQAHPLQSKPSLSQSIGRPMPQIPGRGEHPHLAEQGFMKSLITTLKKQLYKVLTNIQDQEEVPFFVNQHDSNKLKGINKARLARLVIPCVLLVVANFLGIMPTRLFRRSTQWDRLEERHLNGRQCVMNLFVDKHEANEFNPDYDPSLDKEHLHKPEPMEGTYRTKGQVEVINRFISSVAAAFRPNVSVQQHVVFAGTRDGGHLAQEALKHWPARGTYRTQLHVFAGETSDEMDYDSLEKIEDRFTADEEDVHIYDAVGNVAGHENQNDDDSLDENLKQEEAKVEKDAPKYEVLTDLKNIIFDADEEEDSVIPYLHVDGTSMAMQMSILAQTEHLLEDRKIVVVGLEHTPDLNVNDLIEFFRRLDYKTFMLGKSQLTRIDNLCPEILHNVMDHPSLASNSGGWLDFSDEQNNALRMPPFFVAMPMGRHSKEEMSIQHMYDLFSGASGLLQVKTANDRVANVK